MRIHILDLAQMKLRLLSRQMIWNMTKDFKRRSRAAMEDDPLEPQVVGHRPQLQRQRELAVPGGLPLQGVERGLDDQLQVSIFKCIRCSQSQHITLFKVWATESIGP